MDADLIFQKCIDDLEIENKTCYFLVTLQYPFIFLQDGRTYVLIAEFPVPAGVVMKSSSRHADFLKIFMKFRLQKTCGLKNQSQYF